MPYFEDLEMEIDLIQKTSSLTCFPKFYDCAINFKIWNDVLDGYNSLIIIEKLDFDFSFKSAVDRSYYNNLPFETRF